MERINWSKEMMKICWTSVFLLVLGPAALTITATSDATLLSSGTTAQQVWLWEGRQPSGGSGLMERILFLVA